MPGNERSGEPPKIPTGWHQFQFRIVRDARGRKRKTIFKMDTEDIVAIGAVLIAFVLAIGMIFGAVPINKLTAAIVGLSTTGAAAATIIKARKNRRPQFLSGRKDEHWRWFERAIWLLALVALAGAFAAYAWWA